MGRCAGLLLILTLTFGCATVAVDGNRTFIHTVGDSQVTPVACIPPPPNTCPVVPQPVCYEVKGGTISNNAAMVIPAVFGAIVTAIVRVFVP
jgi:hypothetical protein